VEVWFQDETRVGQQGSISRTWYIKGKRPRLVKQQQFLSAYIYGAVCPAKNKSSAIFATEANAEIMQIHLDYLSKEIEGHAVIIMDRAGWHCSKELQVPENMTILHLPPYSPELNSSENGWQVIKSTSLKNRVFKTVDEIIDASIHAWNIFVEKRDQIRKTCYREWADINQLI
jgi:transposase